LKNNYQNDEFLRKRRERQRKIRRRRLKLFSAFFIVFLIVLAVALSLTVFFPIKAITATGSKQYSQTQIVDYCKIELGDNLFTVSKKDTLAALKQKLPFVEDIEFERTLPDALKIKVTDAKEFTCYNIDEKYYTVSKSGWVLKSYKDKPQNTIEIICENVKCKVGSQIEFSEEATSESIERLIENLLKNGFKINSIDLSEKLSIKASIDDRFIVEFGSLADLELKLNHLKSMIKQIPENKGGKIDLSMWNSQNTQGIFVENSTK
jgi:cell division septal protein FtsQ